MTSTPPPISVVNVIQPAPSQSYKQHHRLLYRGSLSLPDSDLILDGIAFTALLPPTSPISLLKSPLPLALESMRGRASLRFVAIVNLSEMNYDSDGDVSMYINLHSTLTRNFFENVLCAHQVGELGRTVSAVRIGLGDGYGPDESDLLVYGSLLPSQSTLRMTVGRIIPCPSPVSRIRKPRPDDPAPRRPPVLELSKKHPPSKRRHIDHLDDESDRPPAKRSKMGKPIDLKTLMAQEIMVKMPKASFRGEKARPSQQGTSYKPLNLSAPVPEEEANFTTSTDSRIIDPGGLEVSNKTLVRKAAAKAIVARGIPKEHPEFRVLFGWITRGVGFAVRRKINIVKLSREEVVRLVDSHVLMYFDGFGGLAGTA